MKRRGFLKTSSYLAISSLATGVPVATATQKNTKPLILGVFPRRNTKLTFRLFSPLANYLSSALNREVKLATAKNFQQFWQGVKAQRYDIVHFNQYHYIISNLLYNYQVILKNEEFGSSTIAGAITVRKDSGINTIAQLKNKTILFGGGKMAMQSYIAAKWLLQQGGLQDGDYVEKIAINPPNAIISTYNHQADAAGSGDIVLQLDSVKKQIDTSKLKLLATTEQLSQLPWAIKESIDESLKKQIQTLLSTLHETEAGKSLLKSAKLSSLKLATDNDYEKHRKIITNVYGADYGINRFK
jgi:phosphonate transport system substrate-binding protein